jgi:hypothetical protein
MQSEGSYIVRADQNDDMQSDGTYLGKGGLN